MLVSGINPDSQTGIDCEPAVHGSPSTFVMPAAFIGTNSPGGNHLSRPFFVGESYCPKVSHCSQPDIVNASVYAFEDLSAAWSSCWQSEADWRKGAERMVFFCALSSLSTVPYPGSSRSLPFSRIAEVMLIIGGVAVWMAK